MVISSASFCLYFIAAACLAATPGAATASVNAGNAMVGGPFSPAYLEDKEEDDDLGELLEPSFVSQSAILSSPAARRSLLHQEATIRFDSKPPLQLQALTSKAAGGLGGLGGYHSLQRLQSKAKEDMEESGPKEPWSPGQDKTSYTCNPPCIQGRGVCNSNVCFCKSPFSGSTCQHEQTGLYRASTIMVFGFGVICLVLGTLLARIAFTGTQYAAETRLQNLGEPPSRCEQWLPPRPKEQKPKKATPV